MTRPHETGERDDNQNADASYEFTAADYDRTKDAYMEAITTQHDGGTTPLANRWVKFFNCVRHAFPFMVRSITTSQNMIEVLTATIEEHERKYGELALDWDIEKRRACDYESTLLSIGNFIKDNRDAMDHKTQNWAANILIKVNEALLK